MTQPSFKRNIIEVALTEHIRLPQGLCSCGHQGLASRTMEVDEAARADHLAHVADAIDSLLGEWFEFWERPLADRKQFFGHEA